MRSSRRWGGDRPLRRLIGALVALGFLLSPSGVGAAPNSTRNLPDLTGDWAMNTGEKVHIDFSNQTNPPSFRDYMKGGGDCPYPPNNHRGKLFGSVTFKNGNMTGDIWVCTLAEVLVTKCHLDSAFTVPFKTTSISKDAIIGTLTSEWYDPVKGDECRFTRNARKDTQKTFTLTRTGSNPCPDAETEEIKQYSQISNRAVTIIHAVASKTTNAAVKSGLADAQGALNKISRTLGEAVDAGDECDKINGIMNKIMAFEGAIDQINNAGCDSMSLAGGFDNLFRTAGQLGNSFNPFPELAPAFTILSNDQNFFTVVSGELNPEVRWADQFQQVDGYIPNCSQ